MPALRQQRVYTRQRTDGKSLSFTPTCCTNTCQIGAAFLTQKCQIESRTVKFEIWDTAGQERFHSLAPMYYRNAQAAVVVYDVTRSSSLDKARSWVKELQRQASQNIVICLAGNKVDLADSEDNHRQVTYDEGKAFADEQQLLFFETSAKTGEGVQDVFESIARAIPEESPRQQPQREERVNLGVSQEARQGCQC